MRWTRVKMTEEEQTRRERHYKDVLWWNTHMEELRAKYAGYWVGVYREKIAGVSSDCQNLLRELESNGYPKGEVLCSEVTPAPEDITHIAWKGGKAAPIGKAASLNSAGPSKEDYDLTEHCRRDELWFKAHLSELLSKYPNQWVGIHHQQVAGASPDPDALMQELEAEGYPMGEVFCDFVHAKPMNWVFTFAR